MDNTRTLVVQISLTSSGQVICHKTPQSGDTFMILAHIKHVVALCFMKVSYEEGAICQDHILRAITSTQPYHSKVFMPPQQIYNATSHEWWSY